MSASFEITGGPFEELGALALGPWRPRPAGAVPAFAAGAGHGSEDMAPPGAGAAPCWRVDFTGTRAEARAALDAGARSMAHAAARLEALPRCLDEAARAGAAPAPDALVGFAATPGQAAGVDSSLQRILGFARAQARVETGVRDVLHARSVMSLAGDTRVVLARGLDPELARLHVRAVSLAVRTRHLWVRLVATVLAGSARIAAAGLGPAGMAQALPLAWRLARRVLADVQELRQVHAARGGTDQADRLTGARRAKRGRTSAG